MADRYYGALIVYFFNLVSRQKVGSSREHDRIASRPPIRIGIIGATPARGWGTAAHLPALQALEEFEVTAVATTRLTTARATAEVFGVPLAFADGVELVSRPEVDAVAITVKVPEHDRLIRAALAAGKHVFSEWPLGTGLGQAVALADLARASGVQHIVGLQVSAVVALVNKETTVIETGQTVPVTAPDQVVLAGRLENGAVASIAVQGGSAPVTPGFELRIAGTEATLVVRPATPGGIHITDWAISISKPDGSAADLPVPGRLRPIPAAVPAGPPRNVAVLYREFARAISYGQPGRARLRHRRPVPPAAGEHPAGVGHRHPPGHRRLGGHERSRHTAHRRMWRSGPAPPG